MTKDKKETFKFENVIIDTEVPWMLYAYYLSDDNKKNKEVNDIIIDMWYTRNRLVKSYPLVEVWLWFEYKRMWIYISTDKLDMIQAERDRREHIRNAPIIENILWLNSEEWETLSESGQSTPEK